MVTTSKSPKGLDLIILSLFTIFITAQPFYLYGELNLFELGIYLPGIQAIVDGAVPYRDFFHLRGPFELFVPGVLMRFLGESIWVLETYFYAGTVVTLIACVFLARGLYQTRFVLYLMVPVLIARTFPRVSFTHWGGMRYAFGILSILFFVCFLKRRKPFWPVAGGVATALALLTSVEVGVCALFSMAVTFVFVFFFNADFRKDILKGIGYGVLGGVFILIPYGLYLVATGSFSSYIDATYSVVTSMTKVFPDYLLGDNPKNFWEILTGMNPWNLHFKQLTPTFTYLFFVWYLVYRIRQKALNPADLGIVAVASYGMLMYATAFRKIGGYQFEMALQPEKIVLFYMLELVCLYLIEQKSKAKSVQIYGINFLIFAFLMSSIGYTVARYNKRFFAFKYAKYFVTGKDTHQLVPLAQEDHRVLTLPKVKGLVVPAWQAQDINELTAFIDAHTQKDEPVFMFPELGSYSFIVDRPFVGRFPMVTFSWINENWANELLKDLQGISPRFAVLAKDPGPTFEKAYFKIPSNKQHYEEVMRYIHDHYVVVDSTPSLLIYRRREGV